ncbi:hypothetical protein B0H34DRAFT_119350 [Crassisporium funariophilum]|nr:hypothetical protein B0H34DRAFT_119350 [Crassisporium funariophilum]
MGIPHRSTTQSQHKIRLSTRLSPNFNDVRDAPPPKSQRRLRPTPARSGVCSYLTFPFPASTELPDSRTPYTEYAPPHPLPPTMHMIHVHLVCRVQAIAVLCSFPHQSNSFFRAHT